MKFTDNEYLYEVGKGKPDLEPVQRAYCQANAYSLAFAIAHITVHVKSLGFPVHHFCVWRETLYAKRFCMAPSFRLGLLACS